MTDKEGNTCVCIYDWVNLLYNRNWHNIVNQLHFNSLKKEENSRPYLIGFGSGVNSLIYGE